MKLSNSQVSYLRGTTFVFTFKLKTVEGKRKVTGLISGMCKKHAKEQAVEIIKDLSKVIVNVNSIKIVNIQRIDCDFLVVPKEETKYNHASKSMHDFFRDLQNVNGSFPEVIKDLFKDFKDEVVRKTPEAPLKEETNEEFLKNEGFKITDCVYGLKSK